jgi:hypothetical protein
VFLVMMQSEASLFLRRVRADLDDPIVLRLLEVGTAVGHRFRRYFLVRTATGLLTGTVVGAYLWIAGVDGAWIWGMLTFLLYYIPTVGPLLSAVPPTLVAFAESGSVLYSLAILGGLAAIKLFLGDFVDPKLQGGPGAVLGRLLGLGLGHRRRRARRADHGEPAGPVRRVRGDAVDRGPGGGVDPRATVSAAAAARRPTNSGAGGDGGTGSVPERTTTGPWVVRTSAR